MVRYVEIDYIFKHPFEKVTRAYFQKYTCGKDTNVTSIRVLEHKIDPETGEEYMLRRGECVNVLPGILKKLCPYPALEVEEEAWLNKKEKRLRLHCYNLTWSKYASLEEFSCYKACQDNPNCSRSINLVAVGPYAVTLNQIIPRPALLLIQTLFEQRGSISVNGVGSLIGGMFEAFGQRFLQHGAKKGFNIMEDLILSRCTEA